MSRLHTEFAGIAFKNPVVLASGTCGFGRELAECFDIEKLGGLSSKGLIILPMEAMTGSGMGDAKRDYEQCRTGKSRN